MSDLLPALYLSLRVAICATALAALFTIPAAFFIARRRRPANLLFETAITLPLVLPPTVVGYLLILLLGANGYLGQYGSRAFGYSILFRFEGAVVAAAVVAAPLIYLPAKAAFAEVEREQEDLARLFGANTLQLFWHVSLPTARRGVFSGLVLAFARALGEFGATIMVYGMPQNRMTLPISIWSDYASGDMSHALPAVLCLSWVSLVLVAIYQRSLGLRRR